MPCEREKQNAEDKCGVRALKGPLHRSVCTRLPGQLGNTLPFVGTDAVPGGWKPNGMSNSYHMDEHAGGRTKGRHFIRSRILTAVIALPKGEQFAFIFSPAISFRG